MRAVAGARIRIAAIAAVACLAAGAGDALAQTMRSAQAAPGTPPPAPTAEEPVLTTRLALKESGLVSHAPADPILFPERSTATFYWRGRLDSSVRLGARTSITGAYEQRAIAFTATPNNLGVGLPADRPPFRVTPLDWAIASGEHAQWRHEIDRLALHADTGPAALTIGRQAVGWGRGIAFTAIDLFSPFTPLEADREWRRGIDAARAEIRMSDRASVDGVAAFGETWGHSAAVARLRGYAGHADVEIVGGYRAGDGLIGGATSAPLRGAEVHAEAAVFTTTGVAGSVAFGIDRTIVKLVAGASRRLPWAGAIVEGEYHYSGFGAPGGEDLGAFLRDPVVQERYLRGDMQTLRRHAIAAAVIVDHSPLLTFGARWVHTGADDSGVIMPVITATFDDRWSLDVTGYVPYGQAPSFGAIPAQYGATPAGVFVQLRYYR